jgi:AcrR family transcriptional regulator
MTLYRHFPSKEALFVGLVTAMCGYMRPAKLSNRFDVDSAER